MSTSNTITMAPCTKAKMEGSALAYAAGEPLPRTLCPEGTLGHLLLRAARRRGRGITFILDGQGQIRLSYADVLRQARRCLGYLGRAGLTKGDKAILVFRENPDFVITFWACVLGGIVPVPIAYPASLAQDSHALSKLRAVWEQLGRPKLLTDHRFIERLPEIERLLEIPGLPALTATESEWSRTRPARGALADPDDLAFIQFSSGSTGQPKGVMLTHRNLLSNIEAIVLRMGVRKDDEFLSWMPYHHDMGLIGFHLTPLAIRYDQINLSPLKFVLDPPLWLELVHRHRVTVTGSPNFGYRLLLDKLKDEHLGRWDLRCLRLIYNGAEPISVPLIERFGAALAGCGLSPAAMYPVYGMAEASLVVTMPPIDTEAKIHRLRREPLAREGRIEIAGSAEGRALPMVDEGAPVPGCALRIVDVRGEVVAENVVGEVQIRGDNVSLGYYDNPSANAEAFQDGWLRTGDTGFLREGRLCITGRKKDVIFVNGQNYFAHDLEAHAEEVEGVVPGKIAACGWHDFDEGRERVALFVGVRRLAAGRTREDVCAEIWRHINTNLGLALDDIVVVKSIPKTTSGKKQRYRLLQDFQDGHFRETTFSGLELSGALAVPGCHVSSLSASERRVRRIWAEVLDRPTGSVAIDQAFLSQGGTSLKAVQVLSGIEEEFRAQFSHDVLIECHTVREMAAYIDTYLEAVTKPLTYDTLSERSEIQTPGLDTEIAVIGMACRFPAADSPAQYWENLVNKVDAVGEIPLDRWDMNRYYQGSNTPSPGKTNSRWGGFIDNPYVFDADFFHVTPEEATVMDPQQRLFLTVAYETMESAGYAGVHSEGRTIGLFVGASHNNYLEHHLHTLGLMDLEEFQSFVSLPEAQRHALRTEWMGRYGVTELHSNTAVDNLLNMIAARTSHTLNLKGPSLTIDTACSSSLVAVHLACESLRRGECEMALAGGVNLLLTPTPYLLFARAGALSPSGRCKVFDADADGFVPGEGIGTVLLKPLRRALEDRDNVLAVIKGSAVNNDGRSLGVMAPNPDGQRAVMESLYRKHAIHVRDIQYIEAHGTGTAIGDPSEVRALSRAFAELGDRDASCVLGSVKANIGHLLSAAGIASLIKVVLALQHRTMPPSLHLQRPNPLITFEETPFRLLTEAEPWETPIDRPRTAAVSSFGFGGTNCHLVVAEGTARAAHEADARPQHLLAISAHTQEALALRANALAQFLRDRPALPPADVCYTQNTGRAQFEHRLHLRASSTAELAQKLLQPRAVASPSDVRPRVALMFTGQGAQYRNMANALYQALPRFRTTVDECAARFDRYLTRPLLSCIYSPEPDPDLLAQTALTQPAMFTIDYALGRLLMDFGVKPAFLLGHSVGEYVAACLAGVMSLSDATRLVAARGRLIQTLPVSGGMAAVFATSERLTPLLEPFAGRLWFAAHNGSHQVVSGELEALAGLFKALDSTGISYRQLRVSHAFHTPLLSPMLTDYRQVLERAKFSKPRIPIISNVSGEPSHPASFDANYWVEHLLAPVKFEQGVRSALAAGVNVFVECGPDKTLAGLTKAIVSDRASVFATLDRKQEDWTGLLECLGGLYQRGLEIDWASFDADFARTRVAMPTYPFRPKTYRPSTTPVATDDKAEPSSVEPCAHTTTPPVTLHPIALVQQTVADYLKVPSNGIDPTQNFHDLGLDSQGAVEITTRLGRIIDKTLQPTLLFEYQTPVALAEYLEREHGADLTTNAPIAIPPLLAPRSILAIEAQESAELQVREQDIAIIGMACRLPGADDLAAYWQLLRNGKTAITEVDPSRWSVEDYFDPDKNALHASCSKWGAFLNRPHEFDPLFFGVSPREAAAMDPQQRLFMAVAWEALQQSGYGGAFRTREIGVYVGCEQNHYGEHFINYQRYEVLRRRFTDSRWFQRLNPSERAELVETLRKVLRPAEMVADAVAGNGLNEIPARISHWLDLHGPSLMVNTACSSALVALHLACESLRLCESRMAIVGGVYLTGNDTPFVFLSRVGALSPTGACLPFDRRANGMVLGEGVSALVLKPLRDAMVDGDFIHAVIKGSAINNDGHSTGITAPNPRGQADAIRKAYRNAGVSPETVSYIECHGTGTPLGDPVEAQGLKLAFETFTDRKHFCAVGSVKSSIGHMLSAAGIPSLIKVVLAMQHGLIPPTAGFVDPNPYVDFATSPFYLQGDRAIEWQSGQRPRRAGVNAFGFGGTNCHVVLEEAPKLPARAVPELAASPTLLLLTGRTPVVLQRVAHALGDYLAEHPAVQPSEVGLTVNGSQRDLNHKAALIVDDRRHLIEVLGAVARGRGSPDVLHGKANPKISTPVYLAFDSVNPMDLPAIEEMIARFPELERICEECQRYYERAIAQSNALTQGHLDELLYSFAVQYGLGRLTMALEIAPVAILAEGVGVLAGACLTGLVGLDQATIMLSRFALGQRDFAGIPALAAAGSPVMECPLVIPGMVLRPRKGDAIPQLGGYLQLPQLLDAQHVRETLKPGSVCLHLGGSTALRGHMAPPEGLQWIDIDGQGRAVTRLFRALAELYVAGVKFNARPLTPAGVRRVPLPTYPFENKDYHYIAPALPADTGLAEPIALPRPKTHGHGERADGGVTQPPRVASEEDWVIARHQRRATSSLLLQALEGFGGN